MLTPQFTARSAVIFDSNGMNTNISQQSFVPAAIPVKGDAFFSTGERATVQGNGTGFQLVADTPPGDALPMQFRVAVTASASADSSGGEFGAQLAQASIQFDRFIIGSTETAFADPAVFIPLSILDLAGPNSEPTILDYDKAGGQGRLSYLLTDDPHPHAGIMGQLSVEQPIPEIQNVNGVATENALAHYPDLLATVLLTDGNHYPVDPDGPANTPIYKEYWHVQLGSVVRDLSLVDSTNSIHESAFGWGLHLSGLLRIGADVDPWDRDAIGFSLVGGQGIGHYINDLHVVAEKFKTGGNDGFFNPTTNAFDALPADAGFLGYLHHWSDGWQSTVGYSHVDLYEVGAESTAGVLTATGATMYRRGDYAVANFVYHTKFSLPGKAAAAANIVPEEMPGIESAAPSEVDQPKGGTKADLYAGIELLLGEKEELSGNSAHDDRIEFVISLSK
jgi:hypothetical protein